MADSMVYITRRETFNAAHRLFRPEWDDQKNLEVFGKCSNPLWHGHNYVLYVTVKGHLSPDTGFLVNLKDLSAVINRFVVEKLDHKNLNLEVDFMAGKIASTESLAVGIWQQLEVPVMQLGAILHCIKLYETEKNSVEYFGPDHN
ncbi:MAG TPA: 6-carboxytetrahydropterin synthase [Bacteroidales bacterium]|nr:6-carboxytetrahydropterin synthase [Bacteroidales bacterium]